MFTHDELMFKGAEHIFKELELVFNALEHKLSLGKITFFY